MPPVGAEARTVLIPWGIYWVLASGRRCPQGTAILGLIPLALRHTSLAVFPLAPGLLKGIGQKTGLRIEVAEEGKGTQLHLPAVEGAGRIRLSIERLDHETPGSPWPAVVGALLMAVAFGIAVRRIYSREPASSVGRFAVFAGLCLLFRLGLAGLDMPGALVVGALFSSSRLDLILPAGLSRSPFDFFLTVSILGIILVAFLKHIYPKVYDLPGKIQHAMARRLLTAGLLVGAATAVPMLLFLYLHIIRGLLRASRFSYFPPGRVWHDAVGTVMLLCFFLVTLCFLFLGVTALHTLFRTLAGFGCRTFKAGLLTVAAVTPGLVAVFGLSGAEQGFWILHLAGVLMLTYFLHLRLKRDRYSFNHVVLFLFAATLFCFPSLRNETERKLGEKIVEVGEARRAAGAELAGRLQDALDRMADDPSLASLVEDPASLETLPALICARSGLVSPGISCHVRMTRYISRNFSYDMPTGRKAGTKGRGGWEHPAPEEIENLPHGALIRHPGVGDHRGHTFVTGRVHLGRKEDGFTVAVTAAVLWPFVSGRTFSARMPPPFQLDGAEADLVFSQYVDEKLVLTSTAELPSYRPLPPAVVEGFAQGADSVWTEEDLPEGVVRQLYFRDAPAGPNGAWAVGYRRPVGWRYILEFLRLFLLHIAAGGVLFFLFFLVSFPYDPELRGNIRFRFKYRLLLSFTLIAILPLIALGTTMENMTARRVMGDLEEDAAANLQIFQDLLETDIREYIDGSPTGYARPGLFADKLEEYWYENVWYAARSDILRRDFDVYIDDKFFAGARGDPYKNRILSSRMPASEYRRIVLGSDRILFRTEQVGTFIKLVGYKRLVNAEGRVFGALSMTRLLPRMDLDREIATQISFVLTLYLFTLLAVALIGVALARRISRPVEELTVATREVATGNLEHRIELTSRDEIGELVSSFNRMTQELQDNRMQIIRAEKEAAWGEMARQIAHEIKNPLTPMRLSTGHILKAHRDRHPRFESILQEGLERIAAQIDALGKIASEFSDFARFPHRRPAPENLEDIVSSAVRLLSEEVRCADPPVNFNELYDEVPFVDVDRDEMERVVFNVIKNAVQALRETGGTVRVSISIGATGLRTRPKREGTRRVAKTERKLKPRDEVVEVAVEDNGPGIPAEIQPRLFEPYFSTKSGGTGLGLAICKKSVSEMGGEIVIMSEEGVGTTVTIRLPVSPKMEEATPDDKTPTTSPEAD